LRLSDRDHILSLIVHRSAFDDASAAILVRQLAAACSDQPALERSAPVEEIPVDDAAIAASLAYWNHQLAGFTPSPLPADLSAPTVPSRRAAQIVGEIPAELTAGVRTLARQAKVTPFI